jgi:dTDP-glucose 4,6-dehydratase
MKKERRATFYNIGARNERQNIDVVMSLLDAVGKSHSLIQFVTDRLGHDRRYAIDPTKAETELGWKPLTSWESGLENTIAWYSDNQEWVNHIRNGEYRNYYKTMYGASLK